MWIRVLWINDDIKINFIYSESFEDLPTSTIYLPVPLFGGIHHVCFVLYLGPFRVCNKFYK